MASLMDGIKAFAIEWLEWGAEYFRNDPKEFFTRLFMILLPLFALSGILAYFLIKQIDKEEKLKQRRDQTTKMIKKAKRVSSARNNSKKNQ